jgi:hypothetical protein
MPSTTTRGIRYPLAADSRSALPPATALQHLAEDADARLAGEGTTAQLDALPPSEKWAGRSMYDTTRRIGVRYDAVASAWVPVGPVVWRDGAGTGPNLLASLDGGFESGSPLVAWEANPSPAYTVAASSAVVRSGSFSAAITSTGASICPINSRYLAYVPAVQAGTLYRLGAWWRSSTIARQARLFVTWLDGAGIGGPGFDLGPLVATTTTGWTEATMLATAPPGAAYALVQTRVEGCSAGETHYVDDVTLAAYLPPPAIIDFVGRDIDVDVATSRLIVGRSAAEKLALAAFAR